MEGGRLFIFDDSGLRRRRQTRMQGGTPWKPRQARVSARFAHQNGAQILSNLTQGGVSSAAPRNAADMMTKA
jgi:hypothetical protein